MSTAERKLVQAAKTVIREIDAEIARVRREAERQVAELRHKRQHYEAVVNPFPARRPVIVKRTDSAAIAGPGAVKEVRDVLRARGRCYQSEVVDLTGLNSGTVTHAIRALSGDGKAALTGNRRRNSPEVEWIGEREQKSEQEPEAQQQEEAVVA